MEVPVDLSVQLYHRVGGRSGLRPVIERFYAKMSGHAVLGQFFEGVDLSQQARRLEDFLSDGAVGEPQFTGPLPRKAHAHMFITQPMLVARVQLLKEALEECGHDEQTVKMWLRVDAMWHGAVRKSDVRECRPALSGKPLLVAREDG